MLVKCKICGNKNEKSESYCLKVNGKNNYYCSEEEYLNNKSELEFKDLFYKSLCECFDYEIKSTMLWKLIAELKDLYSYKILYYTLVDKKSDITIALPNLVNATEVNKLKYTFAIIQNSIKQTELSLRRKEQLADISNSIVFEDEYEEARFLNKININHTKKRKSINDFLDEYEGVIKWRTY